MFDLFRSRDKAVRYLLTGMLALVALSMVTYLIPGAGSGSTGSANDTTVAAQIGSQQVTAQDVSRAVRNMTQNRQLPPELLSMYVPQIVNQMINERIMAYEADRLGLKVTSEDTDTAIVDTLPPQLVKDGKVDSATLSAMLQQEGMTLASLKDSTSRQLLVTRLEQIVVSGVVVSPREIENEYKKRNEKIKVEYAVLAPARFQKEAEPTESELKTYYDSHKSDFKTPEKAQLRHHHAGSRGDRRSIRPYRRATAERIQQPAHGISGSGARQSSSYFAEVRCLERCAG